eukprot:TRINITY_DN2534_c0_g1_i1.p1 TRINITY_DN2534_c0_g1~~TRINITY_DN2534_c0_g1_i1.p1  ORF type:complete len:118 (-),score=21.40 TRINITY_DN2534_c0_g1_i1:3-356(-)
MDKLDIIRQYASDRLDSGMPQEFGLEEVESAILSGGGNVNKGADKQLLKKALAEIKDNEQEAKPRRQRARYMLMLVEDDTFMRVESEHDQIEECFSGALWSSRARRARRHRGLARGQ